MQASTILQSLAGGVMIGGAASGLLLLNGRIAGISSIFGGLLTPQKGEAPWRLAFVAGLLTAGIALSFADPAAFGASEPRSLPLLAAAGLLVGLGARVSNGCTSGHGVCGLARRSPRALVATLTFMLTGAITVYVVRHAWPKVLS